MLNIGLSHVNLLTALKSWFDRRIQKKM